MNDILYILVTIKCRDGIKKVPLEKIRSNTYFCKMLSGYSTKVEYYKANINNKDYDVYQIPHLTIGCSVRVLELFLNNTPIAFVINDEDQDDNNIDCIVESLTYNAMCLFNIEVRWCVQLPLNNNVSGVSAIKERIGDNINIFEFMYNGNLSYWGILLSKMYEIEDTTIVPDNIILDLIDITPFMINFLIKQKMEYIYSDHVYFFTSQSILEFLIKISKNKKFIENVKYIKANNFDKSESLKQMLDNLPKNAKNGYNIKYTCMHVSYDDVYNLLQNLINEFNNIVC